MRDKFGGTEDVGVFATDADVAGVADIADIFGGTEDVGVFATDAVVAGVADKFGVTEEVGVIAANVVVGTVLEFGQCLSIFVLKSLYAWHISSQFEFVLSLLKRVLYPTLLKYILSS